MSQPIRSPNIATRQLAHRWNLTVGQTGELKDAMVDVQYGGIELGLTLAVRLVQQHAELDAEASPLVAILSDLESLIHGSSDKEEASDG